jgi:amino acid transporter
MTTDTQAQAQARQSRADRFYQNPILRDREWEQAKQPPWILTVVALAIVAAAFFIGVYSSAPQNIIGWIVGIVTILVYVALGAHWRLRARRRLRELHRQRAA